MSETFEDFLDRLHCSQISFESLARDYYDLKREVVEIKRMPELDWARASSSFMMRLSALARKGVDVKDLVDTLDLLKVYVSRLARENKKMLEVLQIIRETDALQGWAWEDPEGDGSIASTVFSLTDRQGDE